MTVRNGKQALLKALLTADRLDEIPEVSYRQRLKMDDDEVTGMLGDILVSPVLRQVLCSTHKQFFFNPTSVIVARLNRAELGDFDALVLGLLLMAQFKGQIVVPDWVLRQGRACRLIREQRLVAGVPPSTAAEAQNGVLLIEDKEASGAR